MKLVQKTGDLPGREIILQDINTVGRTSEATIVVNDVRVSRQHAEIRCADAGWIVTDLGSTNGTFIGDTRIEVGQSIEIDDGALLRFGRTEFVMSLDEVAEDRPSQIVDVVSAVTIGRDWSCDIVLDYPSISLKHCRIVQSGQGHQLEDLGSSYGTYLNGVRIAAPERLCNGDEIRIGLTRFSFRDGTLRRFEYNGSVRLDVDGLNLRVGSASKSEQLLHDVTFVVQPRELVAIVGASGAGKSTLLNALTGLRPADEGSIRVSGLELQSHLDILRNAIGYVPQQNVVHSDLSVTAALRYAANLRLPPDTSPVEVETRVSGVLAELGLSHRAEAKLNTLSGGEQKRVNLGMEMLTRPSLLFLDEPTSGLDPGLEHTFFQLMKQLAADGRTIVIATHAIACAAECDKLLFLAPGGHVAYFGPPAELLSFVGVSDFTEAYIKISNGAQPAAHWETRYRSSEMYEQYIRRVLMRAPVRREGETLAVARAIGATREKVSSAGQFGVLSRRYVDVIRGDPRNVVFLLAQAPVIALLLMAVFPAHPFTRHSRFSPAAMQDAASGNTGAFLLFCMAISAILFGVVNSVREITKERPIFRHERLINIGSRPYLASKIAVLSVFCLIQTLIFVGVLHTKVDFGPSMAVLVEITGTLFMSTFCGMLLGLAVSAVARTTDQAVSLVPLAILPQVVFSGLINLSGLHVLDKVMPSYWSYGLLGRLVNMNALLPVTRPQFAISLVTGWSALAALSVVYAVLSYWILNKNT